MITATHTRSASQRKYQNYNVIQEKSPRPKFRKAPKVFTPLKESQTQLYERLKAMGIALSYRRKTNQSFGKILQS